MRPPPNRACEPKPVSANAFMAHPWSNALGPNAPNCDARGQTRDTLGRGCGHKVVTANFGFLSRWEPCAFGKAIHLKVDSGGRIQLRVRAVERPGSVFPRPEAEPPRRSGQPCAAGQSHP